MIYIKQLSTYTDLQTQISVQFPWRVLWHFTAFCKEIIYFIQGPPTMKDTFLLLDSSVLSLIHLVSESFSENVRLSTDELRKRSNSALAYLCYNYRPSHWVEIGWKAPYFALNVGWLHCIFIFLWEAFQVQHLRNKGRYQLR